MARYASRAGVLVVLACTTPLGAQRSRVIDSAGIAAAGWHRLGDIALALPLGTTATIDGFNYALTGSRQGFSRANSAGVSWMVRVDAALAAGIPALGQNGISGE